MEVWRRVREMAAGDVRWRMAELIYYCYNIFFPGIINVLFINGKKIWPTICLTFKDLLKLLLPLVLKVYPRRRIHTEEKAKLVTAIWAFGFKVFFQFLSKLAVLH